MTPLDDEDQPGRRAPGEGKNVSPVRLTGRCMCGAVVIEVAAALLASACCHCQRCRRRSGTPYSLSGLTVPGSFRVSSGLDRLRHWNPGDGWVKWFCEDCGSHAHTSHPDNPEMVAVRLGCLDQDPGVRPSAHQFVASAAPWFPVPDDGLPRFPERIPATALAPEQHRG